MTEISLELCKLLNSQKRWFFPYKPELKTKNGIYILFEREERFHNLDRISRVGTHRGHQRLLKRLDHHFVKMDKNWSVFRRNIGLCLLNKDQSNYGPIWELKTKTKAEKERNLHLLNPEFEYNLELKISSYLQENVSFCVIKVDTKEDRLYWEGKIASTLAGSMLPSVNWLGNFSPKGKIKTSGLWQEKEQYGEPLTKSELIIFKSLLAQ